MRHLADVLVENYLTQKPLLEGARLYRGSSLPDQSPSSAKSMVMHASLSLVAADKYANQHGRAAETAYIGEYAFNRNARIHSDYGHESNRGGRTAAEIEEMLRPMVEKCTQDMSTGRLEAFRIDVEAFVSKNAHEVMIPAFDEKGAPVKPDVLYEVQKSPREHSTTGRLPTEISREAKVVDTWERIEVAKDAFVAQAKCPAALQLDKAFLKCPPATKDDLLAARNAIIDMLQHKHSGEISHLKDAPLQDFISAARSLPVSAERQKIADLGVNLIQRSMNGDPAATLEAGRIKNLPREAGSADTERVSGFARDSIQASHEKPQEAAKAESPQKTILEKSITPISWKDRSSPENVRAMFDKAMGQARVADARTASKNPFEAAKDFARESVRDGAMSEIKESVRDYAMERAFTP